MSSKVGLPPISKLMRQRSVGLIASEFDQNNITVVVHADFDESSIETYRLNLNDSKHHAWFRGWIRWDHVLDELSKHNAVYVDFLTGNCVALSALEGTDDRPPIYSRIVDQFESVRSGARMTAGKLSRFGSHRNARLERPINGTS